MAMRIVVRLDSSVRIGTGHLMRCLTLAEVLRQKGISVSFACRPLPGNMMTLIEARGHTLRTLPGDDPRDQVEELLPDWEKDAAGMAEILNDIGTVDWLIVDHYGLDYRWERAIRPFVRRIMAIDDLANRRHECDLLLDQNYYLDADTRYAGLIPESTQTLLGPRYALLRPEFEAFRHQARSRNGLVKTILVFLGGTDPDNVTAKAIRAMQSARNVKPEFHVVVGGSNPHRKQIEAICRGDPRFRYQCQAENMAELMAKADLTLGAGGATTWERCFLGLPAIIVATATNQIKTTQDLAANGVCWFLGRAHDLTEAQLVACVTNAIRNPGALRIMSVKAMDIMGEDDTLPTGRIVSSMLDNQRGLGST